MKNKNVLLVFLGIILVAGILFIGLKPVGQVIYSSTVSSISNAYIIDGGDKIVVQMQISPSGNQNLKIDFDLDDINSFLNEDGYEVKDISTLYMSMSDPSRDFFASSQRVPVYEYGYYRISSFRICENNKPNEDYILINSLIDLLDKYCIYKYPVGSIATFSSRIEDNADVTFRIDGTTIGTVSPSSGRITASNNKVDIRWNGNLANYQQITTPSSYALFNDKSQFTKMVYYSSISAVQNAEQDAEDYFTGSGIKSFSGIKSEISDVNNQVNTLLTSRTTNYKNDVGAESVQLTDEGIKVYTDYANVFPTFTITLDAEYVAIEKLSGIPDITSCIDSSSISSTQYYNGKLSVKNKASSSGSFYGSVECSGSSKISEKAIQIGLVEGGETKTVNVQLTGVNTDSGTQSNKCLITIYDAESNNKDTCSFNLDVKYVERIICEADKTTCFDLNTLQTCNSDGSDFELTKCTYGCIVLDSGEGICKTSTNKTEVIEGECGAWISFPEFEIAGKEYGGQTLIPNLFCIIGNFLNKLFTPIKIVLMILGAFVSGIFSYRYSRDRLFKSKKDKWMQIVAGLLIGLSVGYLIYTYFLLGIVTLIILGGIKFILK